MVSLTVSFFVVFLAILHNSSGCSLQCNPTNGSMFAKDPSVVIFANTFIQQVFETPILREAFDLSKTTVIEYSEFNYKYSLNLLNKDGYENLDSLAEFANRAIAPNFDVLIRPFMARFKANLVANYLFVEGILRIENAKKLSLKYAQTIKRYARKAMTEDPNSKFAILADSCMDFMRSISDDGKVNTPLIVFLYGNEWFVAALNYKCFNEF